MSLLTLNSFGTKVRGGKRWFARTPHEVPETEELKKTTVPIETLSKRRRLHSLLMNCVVVVSACVVVIPVISIFWTALTRGIAQLSPYFLTHNMRGIVGGTYPYGGILHAISGTVEITGVTMLICAPLGIFAAVYINEYARQSRLSRLVVSAANIMSGIPSILAGLFAYALFSLLSGVGTINGFVGVVALAVLALPTVIKTSLEAVGRVPDTLRESALALGASRSVMIRKVVLRTALPGLVSAVILAIARIIGETAPLMIAAGIVDNTNFNLFSGRMMTLPAYIYNEYSQGLATCPTAHAASLMPCDPQIRIERAWAAALVLILLVAVFNAVGHWVARRSLTGAHHS